MKSPFSDVLEALVKHRGCIGSMVVGESDGIIVDSNLQVGLKGEVVAALSASLFRRARRAAQAAGYGHATFLQLEAQEGRVCITGANDLVLLAIAEPKANVGLIRLELLRGVGVLG
jgi:predicted regulator of Ras-like GTPase activity (Roadblock/LC7/MglB family)